jgi:membrane protein
MIWMYLNSLILLIGFELNASIELSKRNIRIVKPRYNSFRAKKQTFQKINHLSIKRLFANIKVIEKKR